MGADFDRVMRSTTDVSLFDAVTGSHRRDVYVTLLLLAAASSTSVAIHISLNPAHDRQQFPIQYLWEGGIGVVGGEGVGGGRERLRSQRL